MPEPRGTDGDAIQAGTSPRPAFPRRPPPASTDVLAPATEPTPAPRSEAYFGAEVQECVGRPVLGTLLLALVAAVLLLGWHFQAWRAAGALAPLGFVLAAAWLRPSAFPVRYFFDATGVTINRRRTLPYAEIQEAFAVRPGPERDFEIYLLLADDCVILPARLSVRSWPLWEFLRSQPLGGRGEPEAPALFDNFLKQQRTLVEARAIYVFRGSRIRVPRRIRRYRRAGWWLALLTLAWFALAGLVGEGLYAALGALVGVFAFILLIGSYTPLRHAHARLKDWDGTALIITPHALALQQGDLKGELRWEEVLRVARQGLGFRATSDLANLQLKVRGATIIVPDVYQWPLDCAAALIESYAGK